MDKELKALEPAAKVLAATAVSQSLSFCMERKYLQGITDEDNRCFGIEAIPSTATTQAAWIEITQVGRPLEELAESCFTAIQKILYSCFLPKETQLLFLITENEGENKLYLGLRSPHKATPSKSMVKNLNEFIKGVWPGLQTKVISENDSALERFKQNVRKDVYEYTYALTGIPSMETQYKTLYPATIDKLIAGTNQCKNFAYLVVADPIASSDAEEMLYRCREMNGQAESLKSMNVTEGLSSGTSTNHTRSHTDGTSTSHNVSISRKDFTKVGKAALTVTGLGTATTFFPAAGAVLEGATDMAGSIATAAVGLVTGSMMASNVISGLMPQKTISDSEGTSTSDTTSDSFGTNESKSHSISRNIVNKHIEAVSEHLFYHSKRIETGKAIGLWKVGTYIMADKKSDLQGAGLQLRSILSGQETIFEPIRIHDITDVLERDQEKGHTYKELTIGNLASPIIAVNDVKGKRFEHPLGEHFKELKTVLTTKELSYLVNFPLRSVPGISVIDSSPEFCLTPQHRSEDTTIDFGKLLYGGTPVNIPYHLTLSDLSKHTLLSGINGSGKTNTVMSILNATSNQLPFLIIEPAKTEYVDWAVEYNKLHPEKPITIYMPGCKTYRDKTTRQPVKLTELKLNPFEVVWLDKEQEPNVLSHIDRLKSTFAAAFPMYDILPVLMEDLIYSIYQNKSTDWLSTEPKFGETMPPTLNSMSVGVNKVISDRQYEPRIEQNMKACLNTRIDSLKRGWKGRMLNTVHSTSWKELFERPVIINLSYVGDDVDKGFFMSLILQFLYEYRTALAELGRVNFNDNTCKHLTIIEEAHRVMMKCEKPDMPQYKTAMMFANMLSEIRAYGEGMFLVDQVPTRLIPDAIKNTNTKITHRLVAEDDTKAIAEAMGLSKEQRKIIPKLMVGECLVSTALTPDKYWVKVNKSK